MADRTRVHHACDPPALRTGFEQRLEKAIQRGERVADVRARAEAQKVLNEQQLRELHTQFRLDLSEHIEERLGTIADQLPGFRVRPVASDRGWGTIISREMVVLSPGRPPTTSFSRLELLIRPLTEAHVLELAARGVILNRECLNRRHYSALTDVDLGSFQALVDAWTLEFAELYMARS